MTIEERTEVCTISTFDPNRCTGTIILDRQHSLSFDRNQCRSYKRLKPGDKVDVVFHGDGTIKSLLPTPVL